MKTKEFLQLSETIFFKRWENKSYSIFRSIGKVVIILMLPIVYLSAFHVKMYSQDTLNLQNIVVHSIKKPILFNENFRLVKIITNQEIKQTAASSITDLLNYALGVDVRKRGADDVQADISVRGGTFDQVLIMINGVPLSDPQTGHHSFILPVDIDDVQSIEILQGPGTRLYGLNAFSGAINFITKPSSDSHLKIKISAGQFGYRKLTTLTNFSTGKMKHLLSLTNAYSDGYSENTDFSITKFYYTSSLKNKNYKADFQLGGILKKFGAYNFYTPAFPYQYEVLNNEIASAHFLFGGKIKSSVTAYYRRNQDKFELFRETDNWYIHTGNFWIKNGQDTAKYVQNMYIPAVYYHGHNYHVSQIAGASYYLNFSSKLGKTSLGADFRHTFIRSNVLGNIPDTSAVPFEKDAFFTKKAFLDNLSLSVDHSVSIGKIDFSAGANANYNSMFGFYYATAMQLAMRENSINSTYFSVNQGLRLPTFTDLYYQGPSNIGNKNLKPEKSTTFELGHKIINHSFAFQSAVFYRLGRNVIDWVKISDESKWQPMNYTKLNTFGIDLSAKIYFNRLINSRLIKIFDFNYQYLYQSKQQQAYISRYVLDYPKNTVSFSIIQQPFENFTLSWNVLYKQRLGTYTHQNEAGNLVEMPYNPYWLIDVRAAYQFKKFVFYASCTNLLNTQYYDLSNVKLPGRWIRAGVSFSL